MRKLTEKQKQQAADDLGQIRATLADLKDSEALLRDLLIDAGVDVVEGELFRVNVVESSRTSVDWKAIAAKLKPSRQLVKSHTSQSVTVSVRVTARVGVAA